MKKPLKIVIIVLCVAVCAVGVYLLLKRDKSNKDESESEPTEGGEQQFPIGGGGYAAPAGSAESAIEQQPDDDSISRNIGLQSVPRSKPIFPKLGNDSDSRNIGLQSVPVPSKKEKGLKL